jgi:hypothetical protein
MTRRNPYAEDPLTYRIAYSRIAQELHARSQGGLEPEDHEHLPIPAARVREAIAAVQREVPARRRPAPAEQEPELGDEERGEPAAQARELVDQSREELLRLGDRWVGQRGSRLQQLKSRRWSAADSRLASFLACVVEPASVAMHFSSRVEEGWTVDFAPLPKETEPVDRRLEGSGRGISHDWLHSYLERIRQTDAEISYRARYNLACLFSRSAWRDQVEELIPEAYTAEAVRQLELCLAGVSGRRRTAIQSWAWRDPAFAGLRELAWEEFSRILGPLPEGR